MTPPVVITGASGFIGRSLCAALRVQGHVAFALTRQPVPEISDPLIQWHQVNQYGDFKPPDGATIIHLSEPPHISAVDANGEQHIEAMETQAKQLLERPYGRVIYASSATTYGDMEDYPRRPDEPIQSNPKIYAQSKLRIEKIILDQQGICARITNLYGPHMSELSILSDIFKQLPESGPLMIRELSPVRDYLWIDDLSAAFVCMLQNQRTGIYNIASGTAISCEDLARLVLRNAGQADRQIKSNSASPRRSVLKLDITKTITDFGWRPETPLDAGIQKLLITDIK